MKCLASAVPKIINVFHGLKRGSNHATDEVMLLCLLDITSIISLYIKFELLSSSRLRKYGVVSKFKKRATKPKHGLFGTAISW